MPSWVKYTVFAMFGFFSSFGAVSLYGATTKAAYPKIEKLYLWRLFKLNDPTLYH
jgi:hypothetical protein